MYMNENKRVYKPNSSTYFIGFFLNIFYLKYQWKIISLSRLILYTLNYDKKVQKFFLLVWY